MNKLSNKKFIVSKYQSGWIAKRRSDGMKIYFEDLSELKQFINS